MSIVRTFLKSRTAAYYLTFIALGLSTASLGPTLLGLSQQTGSELGKISILFTMRSLGYLVGAFAGGRLFDRMRAHRIIAASLVMMSLLLVLVPLLPSLPLLAAIMLPLGILEGMVDVGGNTLIVWLHRERVAPFMNALHLAWAVGAFLSPVLVAQALRLGGHFGWSYLMLALLILPVAFRIVPLPEPDPIVPKEAHASVRPELSSLFWMVLFFALVGGGEVSFGGWIYTYSVKTGVANETAAAYLNAAFWGAFTLSRAASIPISAFISARGIIILDLVISLAALGLMVIFPFSTDALWIGSIIFGVGAASAFPAMLTFAGQRMVVTGSLTGWFFVGSSAGAMILPWIIGQRFETAGPQITLVIIGAALTGGLIILMLFPSQARVISSVDDLS